MPREDTGDVPNWRCKVCMMYLAPVEVENHLSKDWRNEWKKIWQISWFISDNKWLNEIKFVFVYIGKTESSDLENVEKYTRWKTGVEKYFYFWLGEGEQKSYNIKNLSHRFHDYFFSLPLRRE